EPNVKMPSSHAQYKEVYFLPRDPGRRRVLALAVEARHWFLPISSGCLSTIYAVKIDFFSYFFIDCLTICLLIKNNKFELHTGCIYSIYPFCCIIYNHLSKMLCQSFFIISIYGISVIIPKSPKIKKTSITPSPPKNQAHIGAGECLPMICQCI
ncbi:unnamed protein product, partial [Meganyctiphanes norvegica]